MLFLALLLILLAAGHKVSGWDNDWDQPLNRRCNSGQAVSEITSVHSNQKEDRRWSIHCKSFPRPSSCHWTGYVNDFDEYLYFRCPVNHVIAGMQSYHSNHHEDRRWRFYCCKSKLVTFDCKVTTWVNYWDELFHWFVPGANYLTGVISYHDNHREDRRWRFRYCRMR